LLIALSFAALPALAQETAPPAEPPAATAPAEPAAPPAEPAAPAAEPAADTPATEEAADSTEPAATLPAIDYSTPAGIKVGIDTMWVLITGFLVFFMNLGFACVESGFCRAKNAVNILSKNFIVFSVTTLGFWLIGWGIMFGNSDSPWFGKEGLWMVSNFSPAADNSPATGADYKGVYSSISWTGIPLWAKFFFQLVFAGTAATIVSGAVAERIKYHAFIVFSLLMAIFIYPVVGHWIWGGGYLQSRGFMDFAGSTQVHSIGGWAALTGVLFLGPRLGKYKADGKVSAIPGHNMTAATIGCLILWFGWFGFNPGSTMGVDAYAISEVALTTNLAAAAGTLTATATAWLLLGKPDLGMTLNGCLAGLVAITAPCAFVSPLVSIGIGAVGGVLVVLGVLAFDRLHIDDPVGATSVHLLNGVFGTLCVGLFATPDRIGRAGNAAAKAGLFYAENKADGIDQFMDQLIGVGLTAGYVLVVSSICWLVVKAVMGLRVSQQEEIEGLDIGEHGIEAYYGFVMATSKEG
jgi:Amt family ammonium transporter